MPEASRMYEDVAVFVPWYNTGRGELDSQQPQ